jgi:hypothetical protein
MMEIPLASITHVVRKKTLLNKDRIAVVTSDGEYHGWKDLSPLLRDALTNDHGRRVTDDSPDGWRGERLIAGETRMPAERRKKVSATPGVGRRVVVPLRVRSRPIQTGAVLLRHGNPAAAGRPPGALAVRPHHQLA